MEDEVRLASALASYLNNRAEVRWLPDETLQVLVSRMSGAHDILRAAILWLRMQPSTTRIDRTNAPNYATPPTRTTAQQLEAEINNARAALFGEQRDSVVSIQDAHTGHAVQSAHGKNTWTVMDHTGRPVQAQIVEVLGTVMMARIINSKERLAVSLRHVAPTERADLEAALATHPHYDAHAQPDPWANMPDPWLAKETTTAPGAGTPSSNAPNARNNSSGYVSRACAQCGAMRVVVAGNVSQCDACGHRVEFTI